MFSFYPYYSDECYNEKYEMATVYSISMSGLTKTELEYCKMVTDKLYDSNLSGPFRVAVDPVRDGVPDYFDIIKKPMDLSTIRGKLDDGKYQNSSEWVEDIMLVWKNCTLYNKKGTTFHAMAQILMKKSMKYTEKIPTSELDQWYLNLLRASAKISNYLKVHQATPQPKPQKTISSSKHRNAYPDNY